MTVYNNNSAPQMSAKQGEALANYLLAMNNVASYNSQAAINTYQAQLLRANADIYDKSLGLTLQGLQQDFLSNAQLLDIAAQKDATAAKSEADYLVEKAKSSIYQDEAQQKISETRSQYELAQADSATSANLELLGIQSKSVANDLAGRLYQIRKNIDAKVGDIRAKLVNSGVGANSGNTYTTVARELTNASYEGQLALKDSTLQLDALGIKAQQLAEDNYLTHGSFAAITALQREALAERTQSTRNLAGIQLTNLNDDLKFTMMSYKIRIEDLAVKNNLSVQQSTFDSLVKKYQDESSARIEDKQAELSKLQAKNSLLAAQLKYGYDNNPKGKIQFDTDVSNIY